MRKITLPMSFLSLDEYLNITTKMNINSIDAYSIDAYSDDVIANYYKRYEGTKGLYFKRLETDIILKSLGSLKKNKKVLDIGMGCGRLYPIFSNAGIEYYGIDLSEKMVEAAKNKYPEIHAKNVSYLDRDALQQRKYDYVVAVGALEYVEQSSLKLHLETISSYIKLSGRACVTLYNKEALWHSKKSNLKINEHTVDEIITILSKIDGISRIEIRSTFHIPNKHVWCLAGIFGKVIGINFIVLCCILIQKALRSMFRHKGNELIVSWSIE